MYQEFAAVYDRFMDDFDYPAWADYYLEILKRQGYGGGEICECGCGTGSLSIELLKRGVKLISSDISEDMLRISVPTRRAAPACARGLCARICARLNCPIAWMRSYARATA